MKRDSSATAAVLGGMFGAGAAFADSASRRAEFFEVLSLLTAPGWSWLGLAIVAGWLGRTIARGALTGVLALFAIGIIYYGMDSVLRQESASLELHAVVLWSVASATLGAALGAVGATTRNPGALGLLAKLVLPVGAVAHTTLTPLPLTASQADTWARVIVWVAAAAFTGIVTARYAATKVRNRRRAPDRTSPLPPPHDTLAIVT